MYSIIEQIKNLGKKLFPNGRAFWMPGNGVFDKLNAALAESEKRFYNDALSLFDSIIADNPNFNESDAEIWERTLGIITSPGVPLASRIMAINQKINFPGTDAPRQHHTFIQSQLQAAGFNVFIYKNNFGGVTKTPEQIVGVTPGAAIHSPLTPHGSMTRHGGVFNHKIVNYIEELKDAAFVVGPHLRNTFFIAGPTVDTFATVPENRRREFRQLILQLKPAHMVGYLFVNYI